MKETEVIVIGKKTFIISFEPFDTDIDLVDLTSIHHNNIYGEMATISTLLNKVGIFKEDVEEAVKNHDLELAVYKSDLFEMYRKKLSKRENYVRKEGYKIVEPGNTELENNVYTDKGYQMKVRENIRIHKHLGYINSLYWSLKEKCDIVKNLSKNTVPQEFQSGIITGEINTIMLKEHKNILPQNPL
jgi:hypothetical protein